MKHLKRVLAGVLAATMALSLAACQKDNSGSVVDKIREEGVVTMATNAEFEPFEYMDGDNIVGIDVTISEKIAEKLGAKLQITNTSFDALTMELQTGKCDFVAAGMSYDEDKLNSLDFSDPYFDASQSIIVLKGSDIKGPEDLSGKKVGVQLGTTGDTYCTDELKDVEVNRMNKAVDAVTDLINGKIDAVVVDDFPAQKLVEKNSDKVVKLDEALTVEQYCIAVPKGDEEMLEVVNSVIKEMKESGELDKLIDQYKDALGA